jgi:uncharacterized membrane-anchored protein
MKKMFLSMLAIIAFVTVAAAKGDEDSLAVAIAKERKFRDSVSQLMKYETGTVILPGAVIKLNLPAGFKYLDIEQSKYVITDLWRNPPSPDVLGMIFPENSGPFGENSYAFVLSYDPAGFVKDDDAADINYDDMLKQMQQDEIKENKARIAEGYASMHIVGWAVKPFYDKTNKVLHWAQNIHFGRDEVNTLNYEVRILGRKGILSMNAVATMDELDSVKKDIDKVLAIPSFTDGNAYKDFDSKTDEVAEWTIGGLVAGKILLKAGVSGAIIKFFAFAWKYILVGIAVVLGIIKKFFRKKPLVDEDQSPPQS